MQKIKMLPTDDVIKRLDEILDRLHKIWAHEDGTVEEANILYNEFCSIRQEYETHDVVVEDDGKLGIMDIAGRLIVPPIYKDFSETYSYDINTKKRPIPACNFDNKYALVAADGKGTPLCGFEYDMIHFMQCSYNLYRCIKKVAGEDIYGVLDDKGHLIVPCEMDMVNPISNNYACLFKGDKMGAMMIDGSYFEPVYDDIYEKEGFLWAAIGAKIGYLNRKGEIVAAEEAVNLNEDDLIACFEY